MAFGYDAQRDAIVVQFVLHGDSDKASYLDTDRPVSLVVYDREYAVGFRSVIVTGRLSPMPEDGIERARAVFDEYGPKGAVNLFPDRDDYRVEWLELRDADKTGRQAADATGVADDDVQLRS
jgi:nitroimidazol reductase NimA-like FMN-containing flavoprotein (pyridoxamine 5'-phosphate oxidase superfamily)